MTDVSSRTPGSRSHDPLIWFGIALLWIGWAIGLFRLSAPTSLFGVWLAGLLVGGGAGALYWNAYRGLGVLPYALTAAAVAGLWAATSGGWCEGTIAVASAGLGLAFTRLSVFVIRFDSRRWGERAGCVLGGLLLAVVALPVVRYRQLDVFAFLTAAVALMACVSLFRPWFELTCEPVLWWMYRIRAAGPGVKGMPAVGPCIVLANHASWLDPLFLAKVLPRRTTPMMTSKFYDKPVIGWLMRRFGVIRVPEKAMKQDTPELREAIAALDRGECVVIFPEGFLRRSEDKPLKRFGRGVWQILAARPDTPVFNCWIEGAWGSYCSYFNGPPTKNKTRDRRRPIGIGVSAAVTVPADVLANHLQTRVFLMNCVLAARAHLGLEALPAVELPAADEE